MRSAPVLALVICLVGSACGAASTQQPADRTSAVPSPAIEAIDEPARDDVAYLWANDDDSSSHYFCLDDDSTELDEPCKTSPEDVEELRRTEEEFEQALRPAEGSEPRKIARLRLTARGPKSQALLIAWRNRADKLCLADSEEDEDGGSGGGPFGPCIPEGCAELCLPLSGTGSGQTSLYLTSGVVTSKADALRITFDDSRVVTYELTGPVVPGFPEYRVFMLDLGRGLYDRLELLQEGKVIAQEKGYAPMQRCSEQFPPQEDAKTKALRACLKAAG